MANPLPSSGPIRTSVKNGRKIENRLFERFFARFPVKFQHTRSEYGIDVFLRDASARGVKISTKERVFLNDSVSIEVKLPDGSEPVTLNGRVVWLHTKSPVMWDAGIELHKIDLMEMQRIFKFTDLQ